MANQIIVTDSGNVQVSITPTNNVQVEISRAAITTLTTVGNANYANVAGTVANSSQPNITSLGTLTTLTSAGNITAPFFIGNVIGNVSGNIVVPGTNTSVLFNDAGIAGASDAFQFNKSSNSVTVTGNLSATNISGNGAGLSAITGANVTGQVGYAAVANSVSGSNVSGAVAYATTANAVAGANVSGQVAYAATANAVAGANVSGAVAYATTANAVAGANVSGQVSYAAVANSVAVANVVGIGNIAVINKDGNSGNVLYGNGVFAAVVSPTSVANANYSNFAGNVVNSAQPNITSLGTLTGLVVAGNATVTGNLAVDGNLTYVNVTNLNVQDPVIELGGGANGAPLTTNDGRDRGTLLHYYTTQPIDAFMGWDNSNGEFGFGSNVTNSNDVMTFNTYGNVRASTFIGNLAGEASSAIVANSANAVAGANVSGQVSYAAVANSVAGANVSGQVSYAAVANSVAGANVSGEVAYAAVANSVAVANVSGIGNIATVNLDGNASTVLYGNGIFAGLPAYDSNYANFAGQVVDATQSNITQTGNLLSVNINNTTANTRSPQYQFVPTGTNVSNAGAPLSSMVYSDYGSQSSNVAPMNWSFVKYRGNATTPTAAANNDQILRFAGHVYNGNTSPRATLISASAPLAANTTFQQANVAWTPGAINLVTGNPNGNITSNTASSSQNVLQFDQYGRVNVVQASQGSGSPNSVIINSYGSNSDGTGGGGNILVQRAHGNRDGNTAVTNSDGVGGFVFAPYNGNSYFNVGAGVTGVVNTTYGTIANGSPVPVDIKITSSSNALAYSTTFQGDGNVQFPSSINVTTGVIATYLQGDGGNISNVQAGNIVGTVANATYATTAGSADSVAGANVSGEVAYAAVANSVAVANVSGIGNIATVNLDGNASNLLTGAGTFVAIPTGGGDANFANYAGNVTVSAQANITTVGNLLSLNINDTAANTRSPQYQFVPTGTSVGNAGAPLSAFTYTDYGSQSSNVNPMNWAFIKSRGNSATPTAAANADQIMRFSGHVYNGNTNPRAALILASAPLAANTTFQQANVAWTPGAVSIATGNPNGNFTSNTATSSQNGFQFDQYGRLLLTQGSQGSGSGVGILMTSYGSNTDGSGGGGNIFVQRARGNRDGSTAVGNGDGLGGLLFSGYNGNGFYTATQSGLVGVVNTAHGAIANGARIPLDIKITSSSNTTNYTTTFAGSGDVSFPGAISASGGITITMNNISTVNPSFGFSTYNNANAIVNPYTFYRARGNVASPAAAQVNDAVSSIGYNIYADSGNTYLPVATTNVYVSENDGAGNVAATYDISAKTITLTGNVRPTNVVFTKFSETVSTPGSVSGTITPDLANGSIFNYTLTGNITLNSLANVATGSSATIVLTQDGTGGRTLTSSMLFAGGSKTLSTSAGAVDIISVFYNGSTYYATLSKGYA